jgi:hypothetical protein
MATEESTGLGEEISYDQETKQLVREFPHESLVFYGRDEGRSIPADAQITLLQQEQISEHLGKGHRLVDVLPLITFPDGTREARAFMVEQTSRIGRESVYQVADYLFKVGYWLEKEYGITDIVPVLIFVHPTKVSTRIEYRSQRRLYGYVDCVACRLSELDAEAELATGNLAAATNVMSMRYAPEKKVDLCARAILLWNQRVADTPTARKYCEHIVKCAGMDRAERVELRQRIESAGDKQMVRTLFDDLRDEGLAKGRDEGLAKGRFEGRAEALLDVLSAGGVELSEADRERIRTCRDIDQLREWLARARTASSAEDLFATH